MSTQDPQASIHLSVTHSGRTLPLSLSPLSPLAHLSHHLATSFSLSPSSLKLAIKGKKLSLDPDSGDDFSAQRDLGPALADLLGPATLSSSSPTKPLKALLIGTPSSTLDALRADEALRAKKHAAFAHHQSLAPFARPMPTARVRTLGDAEDDPERYRFYRLEPFPESVPQLGKRREMLERLAEDPAVRHVMREHRFAVGVLTELHPLLQPTLLGLNTNAGEKVSLRLLTDRLDGTRSYNEVRKVLLHELVHNRHGDHDNSFKELNSLLNKQVAAFESSPSFEPWDPPPAPSGSSASASTAEDAHRLNEEEAERVWDRLTFGLEDEVELRRERAGRAAEERMRRAREGEGEQKARR